MHSANNRRIAKNTLMLYLRMLLMMGISLYTVRVVLSTLGVVDYGIYNVVGGIVTMFSFLSVTMASASQRFFAFELGRNNHAQLKKIFSMTMTIYAMIAVVIVLLAETLGLWFFESEITIPAERMDAARWIYQFAILSFMMTMFAIPYNASIIAHERMKVYAWVSIAEVVLKLVIIYALVVFQFDKLKLYAVLIFGVTTLITFIYREYCKRKFEECRFSFCWDKPLFKEIVSYSGWNLFGALASVFNNQGVNIILNIFFGPVVNASRAVAYQVNSAISQFATNFSTAVNPQIIKYYAVGEKKEMVRLVFQSSKFSYFLLFLISMPLLLETNIVLSVWLKEVPEYVVLFTQLVIVAALVDSLSNPLVASALATGKIKKYQIVVGGVRLLSLPVVFYFFKLGFPPQTAMYILIAIAIISLFLRLIILKEMMEFPIGDYLTNVVLKVILSSLIAYLIPAWIMFHLNENLWRFIIVSLLGLLTTVTSIYFVGLSKNERMSIKNIFGQITNKISNS